MIIVDDCSTDGSSEVIHSYMRKDSRIKYLKTDKSSGSPSLPRNIGIENANGAYIAFLDSDDLWLPEKLQWQVEFVIKNKVKVAYSYYEKIDWNGESHNRFIQTKTDSTYKSLLKSNAIPCLTSIISREAIGKTRFKQIPQEDFCFWLDILKKGYVAYNMKRVTARYRVAKDSRSANKIDMFRGYWNVIRHHQNISLLPACYYMFTYTILGLKKYLK